MPCLVNRSPFLLQNNGASGVRRKRLIYFDTIEYSLGNVNRQSLHEILASEKFEKFINHFYLCNDFKPACKKCVFKKIVEKVVLLILQTMDQH